MQNTSDSLGRSSPPSKFSEVPSKFSSQYWTLSPCTKSILIQFSSFTLSILLPFEWFWGWSRWFRLLDSLRPSQDPALSFPYHCCPEYPTCPLALGLILASRFCPWVKILVPESLTNRSDTRPVYCDPCSGTLVDPLSVWTSVSILIACVSDMSYVLLNIKPSSASPVIILFCTLPFDVIPRVPSLF